MVDDSVRWLRANDPVLIEVRAVGRRCVCSAPPPASWPLTLWTPIDIKRGVKTHPHNTYTTQIGCVECVECVGVGGVAGPDLARSMRSSTCSANGGVATERSTRRCARRALHGWLRPCRGIQP